MEGGGNIPITLPPMSMYDEESVITFRGFQRIAYQSCCCHLSYRVKVPIRGATLLRKIRIDSVRGFGVVSWERQLGRQLKRISCCTPHKHTDGV